MGLLVPYGQQTIDRNFSGRPSGSWGATVTAGTAHVLGTKVELTSGTTYEADLVEVHIYATRQSAVNHDGLVNIYIGAGGAEQPLFPNLLAGWAPEATVLSGGGWRYIFPVHIPRGSRLSADFQSVVASDTGAITIELYGGGGIGWSGAGVETLGAITGSSRGTTVTPGTTSEGTFTTIATSTKPYKAVLARLMGNSDTSLTGGTMAIDVGIGGTVLAGLENFWIHNDSVEFQYAHEMVPRFRQVPSGSALQARLQSNTTDSEAKSVAIYGVY